MKKLLLLSLLLSIIIVSGFAQEIKLPDEKILGEGTRVEKTAIFIRAIPYFNIILPEITALETFSQKNDYLLTQQSEREIQKSYLFLSAGSHATLNSKLFYNTVGKGDTEYTALLESFFTEGHRDNKAGEHRTTFNFDRDKPFSERFSFNIQKGYSYLPGPEYAPLGLKRDFFALNTSFVFLNNDSIVPSLKDTFYNIDNTETNFLEFNLLLKGTPFTFETELERYDVFGEDLSTTSFYQGLYSNLDRLTFGGGIKIIEGHGERFLPSLQYNATKNLSLNISGKYEIPDLYDDILFSQYKELSDYAFSPEEEYMLTLLFTRRLEDTIYRFDISQSYKNNFYTWADTDANGLLEPLPENCWQTSINLNLEHKFSKNLAFFADIERRFLSNRIDFYPEEEYTAGLAWKYSFLSLKFWLSYTGKRVFSGTEMGSNALLNTEILLSHRDRMEWGFGIYNLADKQYFTIPGYPAEGIRITSFLKLYI